jgi:hypothetical protein
VRGFGRFRIKLRRPNPLILSFSPISAFTRVFDALWGRRDAGCRPQPSSVGEAIIPRATTRCETEELCRERHQQALQP